MYKALSMLGIFNEVMACTVAGTKLYHLHDYVADRESIGLRWMNWK
jgi:hypothetical protein